MPEGPSIVILKEAVQPFKGKKIMDVGGNTRIEKEILLNKTITDFRSWGKHFLICCSGDIYLRIHFMLFGSYRINEEREKPPRLHLGFENGYINFYASAIRFLEEDPDEIYDWATDVMNDVWDPKAALKKLRAQPQTLVCDALLDQNIFSGVGNIIKNEILFRIKVHPLSSVGNLPAAKLREMVKQTRIYSFEFYEWKLRFVLKKHWLAHTKKICPRCQIPLVKEYLGKTNRRSFFCNNCQKLY